MRYNRNCFITTTNVNFPNFFYIDPEIFTSVISAGLKSIVNMADSSLDEFFAKKDRSKRKAKSKFTTSDSIAKKLEEGSKPVEFPKRETKEKFNQSSTIPSSNSSNLSEQDDEWKDIEDEKERDYSGLRIQALSISEKEKEEEQFKEQMIDENGEICKSSEGQSGPWKTVSVPPVPVVEEKEVESPPAEEESTNISKPNKAYVPPARRNASATNSPSNTVGSQRHGGKSAPEISSELHFPTLSSAIDSKIKGNSDLDRSFQSVKHGIKSKNETQHELRLDLENKFSALHGD